MNPDVRLSETMRQDILAPKRRGSALPDTVAHCAHEIGLAPSTLYAKLELTRPFTNHEIIRLLEIAAAKQAYHTITEMCRICGGSFVADPAGGGEGIANAKALAKVMKECGEGLQEAAADLERNGLLDTPKTHKELVEAVIALNVLISLCEVEG